MNQTPNNIHYDDKCILHNTDKEQTIEAEVLDFKEKNKLVCSINRSVKITLYYNSYHSVYVGNAAGMEFTTQGPQVYNTKQRQV